MGWTFVPTTKGVKDFLTQELESHRIIKSDIRSGVAYLAIKTSDRVLGLVVLLEKRPNQIGYKLISEDMGPCYYNAPAKVLNALTDPAPNEWAANWRQKCRDNLEPAIIKPDAFARILSGCSVVPAGGCSYDD